MSLDDPWKTTESGYELYREPVIAFAISLSPVDIDDHHDSLRVLPWINPLTLHTTMPASDARDCHMQAFDVDDADNYEVLPAPPQTYAVSIQTDEDYKVIGYDYPGASSPDWDRLCKNAVDS